MAELNDELLKATEDDVAQAEDQPKRNSKDDLISKIINCCADNNIELELSNTKLRRMTKDQLCKVLAEKIEKGVKSQMAAQVGAKPRVWNLLYTPDSLESGGRQDLVKSGRGFRI